MPGKSKSKQMADATVKQLTSAAMGPQLNVEAQKAKKDELLNQVDIAYKDETDAQFAQDLRAVLKAPRPAVQFTDEQKKSYPDFQILVLMPKEVKK
jgi:hypothetical protein